MPTVARPPAPAAALIAALALTLAACGASGTPAPAAPAAAPSAAVSPQTPAPSASPPPAATAPVVSPGGGASAQPATAAPASPAGAVLDQPWATAELTDVATGDRFTIGGLVAEGRTVVLETMAIWCTSCLGQQQRIEQALGRVDRPAVAYVVLAVDPSEDADRLAAYRRQHGFDGRYAVAGRDVSRALAADFGDQVLNPPSTPVILISPSGRVTLTPYGPKSSDQVVSLVEDHRA